MNNCFEKRQLWGVALENNFGKQLSEPIFRGSFSNLGMSPIATPATQNENLCEQVPYLPRKVPRRYSATKEPQTRHQVLPSAKIMPSAKINIDGSKCYAYYTKYQIKYYHEHTAPLKSRKYNTRASLVP